MSNCPSEREEHRLLATPFTGHANSSAHTGFTRVSEETQKKVRPEAETASGGLRGSTPAATVGLLDCNDLFKL